MGPAARIWPHRQFPVPVADGVIAPGRGGVLHAAGSIRRGSLVPRPFTVGDASPAGAVHAGTQPSLPGEVGADTRGAVE